MRCNKKGSPARPRWEMFLEQLYHEIGGNKMDERMKLEKDLGAEILCKANIMTQIARTKYELERLEKEKNDSTLKVSKIRYQINEREEDK